MFVAYPQALSKMPVPQLWAVIFFAMLLCLGIDSQFATVEVIVTTVKDAYGRWVRLYLKRHEVLVLIVCSVSFLFGLPNIMEVMTINKVVGLVLRRVCIRVRFLYLCFTFFFREESISFS